MTKRTVKISELPELTRKEMTHQILNKRDAVGSVAKTSTAAAMSIWKGTAPVKTGRMRAALVKELNKGTSKLVVPSGHGKDLMIINSVNKYSRAHKGFYDRFRRQTGNGFFNAVQSRVK